MRAFQVFVILTNLTLLICRWVAPHDNNDEIIPAVNKAPKAANIPPIGTWS